MFSHGSTSRFYESSHLQHSCIEKIKQCAFTEPHYIGSVHYFGDGRAG